ncbi:MAG: hypothetical protein GY749_42390 [Desulfobacteraceae bacterium]|nr:hypothetical protein [Desulfobacteraceae bacterium]
MKKHSKKTEEEMTTAAEAYLREGKTEGKMETTIEMIENLLKEGADWDFIRAYP